MPRDEDLAEDLPQLAALTPQERARFVHAMRARHPALRAASRFWSLMAGMLFFFTILCGIATLILMVWLAAEHLLGSPFDFPGSTIALIAIAVAAGLAIRLTAGFAARVRALDQRRRTLVYLHTRARYCGACGYDLTGAAPADHREGVIRCPECGLINPAGPS
ncbi:MAG: hypothetical protein IT436_15115 [Phycisphaerales bacterium]|nr:hypothetical protein [Phycisphaerales bacterium]